MRALNLVCRWLLLLAGIGMFLLYLNGAAYRAWLSGGPPTSNPEGWLFSAWNFLSWSLAFLSAGMGAFFVLGKWPRRSTFGLSWLVLTLVLWAVPHIREFLASDACLDAGGRWDARKLRCTHE
jgi:hypothetical protein